jgi:cell division septation protein DedD
MREMHKWKDKFELSLDNRQIFFGFFGLSVVGCFVFAMGVMVGRRVDFGPQGEVAALSDASLELLKDATAEAAASELSFPQGLKAAPKPLAPEAAAEVTPAAAAPAPEAAALARTTPSLAESAPATPPSAAAGRTFTLQMKAFARAEEANEFADRLRRNGHDVRVETEEVRGRVWHRVRKGHFTEWEVAVAAKSDFEKSEHVIAYVVRE